MKRLKLLEIFGPGAPGGRPEGDAEHRVRVRQPRKIGGPGFPYESETEDEAAEQTLQDDEIADELQLEFKAWGQSEKRIVAPDGFEFDFDGDSSSFGNVRANNSTNPDKVKTISLDQPGDDSEDEYESFNAWANGDPVTDPEKGKLPTLGETLGRVMASEFYGEDGSDSIDEYLEDEDEESLKENTRSTRSFPKGDGSEMVTTANPFASGIAPQATTVSADRKRKKEKREAEEDVGLSLEGAIKKLFREYATDDIARNHQHRLSYSDLDFFERTSGDGQFLMNSEDEFNENQKKLNQKGFWKGIDREEDDEE